MKRIAVLTSVRNGDRFIARWISHYGALFGRNNLYIIFDGMDQKLPIPQSGEPDWGVNTLNFKYVQYSRLKGDKVRAARASDIASNLFESYDIVIGTDVDEFLVLDPHCTQGMHTYLSGLTINNCLSPLGVDVGRQTAMEGPLDWDEPFLGQRRFGILSDRYTKSCIITQPMRWGSGFHRVKGQSFTIDQNLFLFHFGSVDTAEVSARLENKERISAGWTSHQRRRGAISEQISSVTADEGDSRLATARAELARPRSIVAWNKPRPIKKGAVITIPARFHGLV